MHLGNASLWKQETLDAISKPDRSKSRLKKEEYNPICATPLENTNTPSYISEENIHNEQAKKAEKSFVNDSDMLGE
jgi:hypothetical protein